MVVKQQFYVRFNHGHGRVTFESLWHVVGETPTWSFGASIGIPEAVGEFGRGERT